MTATIMEPYDAQMTDYQADHDVPMHLSSSDPWLQDIAPMEDDLVFQQKGVMPGTLPTIEVDMEAYAEDEHIEYEMVDDHHVHPLTSGELLDVDVFDASAVQSPLLAVTPLPVTPSVEYPPPQLATNQSPNTEVSLPNRTPPTSQEPSTDASIQQHPGPALTTQPDIIHNVPPVDVSFSEKSLPHQEGTPEERISVLHTSGEQDGFTTPQPDTIPPPVGSTAEVPFHSEGNSAADPADSNNQVRLDQNLEQAVHIPDTASNVVNHSEAPIVHGDPFEFLSHTTEALGPTPQHYPTDGVTTRDPEGSRPASVLPEHLQELPDYQAEHTVVHEQDPSGVQLVDGTTETFHEVINEVSAEVHLETPPPILLSIFSTDQPELCLFNKPSELLPDEDETQERHILFQQAASLYYEPLAHVFEALRQDEYVSTVLELTGNELGLEAYEFDLAITEDNYYGREITLHDIYALHISANLVGPLRLRLYISGVRFIVRYHMLQEGLINLHVDESQDSDHDETDVSQHDDERLHEDVYEHDEEQAASAEPTLETSQRQQEDQSENDRDSMHEYHEASHKDGDTEEVTEQTGEIDLSTLPDFVESPEAVEVVEQEQDAESTDVLHLRTTAPGDALTVDGSSAILDDENDLTSDLSNITGTQNTDQRQEVLSQAEETALDHQDDSYQEDTGSVKSTEAEEALDRSYEAKGEVSEQPDENTHQPGESTNRQSTEPSEGATGVTNHDQHVTTEGESLNGEYAELDAQELQDFDADAWDDELDGEGDPDTTWEAEKENGDESISNESSVTLSSKASKRSFDDFGLEHSDDDFVSESPGSKRLRVE